MMTAVEKKQAKPAVPLATPKENYPPRMDCATAAQLINVSPSYLRKCTAKGLLPAGVVVRHGHRVTYDRDALLRWNAGTSEAA